MYGIDDVSRSMVALASSMDDSLPAITHDAARNAVQTARDVLAALAFTLHSMSVDEVEDAANDSGTGTYL